MERKSGNKSPPSEETKSNRGVEVTRVAPPAPPPSNNSLQNHHGAPNLETPKPQTTRTRKKRTFFPNSNPGFAGEEGEGRFNRFNLSVIVEALKNARRWIIILVQEDERSRSLEAETSEDEWRESQIS
ncbi:hypothetical protein P8452_38085 [Trifolium repens]|nr:hypothetical protein P8452_38085 [Trifolium repens]